MRKTSINMLIELRSSFLPFLLVLAVLGWNSSHCGASFSLDSHGSIPLALSLLHYAIQTVWFGKAAIAERFLSNSRLLCTFSTYFRSLGQQSSWCIPILVFSTLLLFFGSLITFSVLGWNSDLCGGPSFLDSNGSFLLNFSFSITNS